MKKITLLFFLVSITSFAQKNLIQEKLTATDTIKNARLRAVRQVFDTEILKNLKFSKDTIKLDYHYKLDNKGVVSLDTILSDKVFVKNEIQNFFKNAIYTVKPYNDYINGIIGFTDKASLRYYLKEGKIETITPQRLDKFPTFPGCSGENYNVLLRCMNRKVGQHIARRFNIKLANSLGLKDGKHRMYVRFIIDTTGKVVNIESKAPHPILKREAIKMVKSLPLIEPGLLDNKKVKVSFQLPITFIVEADLSQPIETKKQRKKRLRKAKRK